MQQDKTLNKPSIFIYTCPHAGSEVKLRELQAGMEEEGVPFTLVTEQDTHMVNLAYKGAQASPLGVGVGVSAAGVCIHYNKLPERQPLFTLEGQGSQPEWRQFGYNAARLVKSLPFKESIMEESAPLNTTAQLYASVREIVLKVLQESSQDHGEVNTWSKTL